MTLFTFLLSILLSTIFLKLGFAITRTYVDIKLVLFVCVIWAFMGLVIPVNGIIIFIVELVVGGWIFNKYGEVRVFPDFILAFVVTTGLTFVSSILLMSKLV